MKESRIETFPLYFLSKFNLDGKEVLPAIPDEPLVNLGHANNTTARVVVCGSVQGCLMDGNPHPVDEEWYIHVPEYPFRIYWPDRFENPLGIHRGEGWILDPVTLKCTGRAIVGPAIGSITYQYDGRVAGQSIYEVITEPLE